MKYILGTAVLFLLQVTSASAEIRTVSTAEELRAALTAAVPGDEIAIKAGTELVGEFVFPKKPFGPRILVRSSVLIPERRIKPEDAPLMPLVRSGSVVAAFTLKDTANWEIQGIQFGANSLGQDTVIVIENSENIVIDRVLMVTPFSGQRRGILANGKNITITRSHLQGFFAPTKQDSQAILSYNGAGPYKITDNYLNAASENVMFGGADSSSEANIPSDIEISGNHFDKNESWRTIQGEYVVKNLLELKSAKRVKVFNNLFEKSWRDAQDGYCIMLTPRNQDGSAPWSVIEDVTFENNVCRDVEHGINVLGYDNENPSKQANNIFVRNNLWVTNGLFLKIGGEVNKLVVDHNTVDNGWNFILMYYGGVWPAGGSARAAKKAVLDLTLTNNVGRHNEYGIIGEACSIGIDCLNQMTGTYQYAANLLAGNYTFSYPSSNIRITEAELWAEMVANYTFKEGSKYLTMATDGTALGKIATALPPPPEKDDCKERPNKIFVKSWPRFINGRQTSGTWTPSSPRGLEISVSFKFQGDRAISVTLSDNKCTTTYERQ